MKDIPEWVDPRMHRFFRPNFLGDHKEVYFNPVRYCGSRIPEWGYEDELRSTAKLKAEGMRCFYCAREMQWISSNLQCCLCTSAANEIELEKQVEEIRRKAQCEIRELEESRKAKCPQDRVRLRAYAEELLERRFRGTGIIEEIR